MDITPTDLIELGVVTVADPTDDEETSNLAVAGVVAAAAVVGAVLGTFVAPPVIGWIGSWFVTPELTEEELKVKHAECCPIHEEINV